LRWKLSSINCRSPRAREGTIIAMLTTNPIFSLVHSRRDEQRHKPSSSSSSFWIYKTPRNHFNLQKSIFNTKKGEKVSVSCDLFD
jgi:hypothetical protein